MTSGSDYDLLRQLGDIRRLRGVPGLRTNANNVASIREKGFFGFGLTKPSKICASEAPIWQVKTGPFFPWLK
jgi:hypothetical protein